MSHKQAKRERLKSRKRQPKKVGKHWQDSLAWRIWIAENGEPRT